MSILTKVSDKIETSNIDPVKKAAVLLEALPFIQRFAGSTFVVKYGGSIMDDNDPKARQRVITDLIFLSAVGVNVIVVHGGGKAISKAMEESGLKAEFKHGLRVTDEATVEIVAETLNNKVNQDICDLIQGAGALPASIKGNNIFKCKKHLHEDASGQMTDLGFVGTITEVDSDRILNFVKEDFMPVISPIAVDKDGNTYNTNADVAAAAVASAVHARRLIYLCDVPGLLSDPEDHDSLIPTLQANEINDLKNKGIIGTGMLPKIDSAATALKSGVRRVHLIDGRMPHSILLEIFTNKGIGTEIVQNNNPWRPKQTEDTVSSS